MPEREPRKTDKWDALKSKLDSLATTAMFAANEAVHDIKYRTVTSSQEREQGSRMAEMFTGEAMSFLNDNLTANLSPLHPTKAQVAIFQFLMNSIDDKSLILKRTIGRMWSNKLPFIVKSYQAGDRFNRGEELGPNLSELFSGKEVNLSTRWGVREPFAHGFSIFGSIGMACPRSIDFMTLPKKAESSEETRTLLGLQERQGTFTQKVEVYNKGERIIIYSDGVYDGKNVSMTDQYFLVGAFDGEGTQKTYWVYGSNKEIHDKMSISQRAGARNTVTHLS